MATAARREWVQADMHCLLCGRSLGRLLGPAPATTVLASNLRQFTAFRPAEDAAPALRLVGGERFRCGTCGGGGVVEDVERFTTYEDTLEEDQPHSRRGRPPKPWRRPADDRLAPLGLAG